MAEIKKLTADSQRIHLDFQMGPIYDRQTHSITIEPREGGFDIYVAGQPFEVKKVLNEIIVRFTK